LAYMSLCQSRAFSLAICVLASFDELYIVPHKMGSYYYPEIKKVHANFNYSFVYIIT
jgi:hypothetical protein